MSWINKTFSPPRIISLFTLNEPDQWNLFVSNPLSNQINRIISNERVRTEKIQIVAKRKVSWDKRLKWWFCSNWASSRKIAFPPSNALLTQGKRCNCLPQVRGPFCDTASLLNQKLKNVERRFKLGESTSVCVFIFDIVARSLARRWLLARVSYTRVLHSSRWQIRSNWLGVS
jgi:hypothetical protein